MQMYAVVATGLLGLLIGFWLGRSIRWNMEETEEAVNRQEERKITGNRQLVMEGTAIGSPVNGEIRKISQDTLQDTTEEAADDNTEVHYHSAIGRQSLCPHCRKSAEALSYGQPDPFPHGQRSGAAIEYL